MCVNALVLHTSPNYTYRSRALLGACSYNSTGRKYVPISEMRLITNDISQIGSALQFEL